MSPSTQALPSYLRKYIAVQDYDSYTALEHATWRYIMRQNRAFFSKHAAPVYLDGLGKTGISLDRIPRVSEMDECLAQFGWGAVPVEGFIPPAAFLDFQSRSVLPIACDMRTIAHIAYTPAPDIVHEAAGHAPILADPQYAQYLQRYARMAQKAIASMDDIRLYESIRLLSDIKENPDAQPAEIAKAEKMLAEVGKNLSSASEAAKVARMNWWTVEYGLVGDIRNPRIFGAGLLSSVGESQNCLSAKVKKIPLTVDCVETAYDITEPQPQLFVARDMDHLLEVLISFESTLSFLQGGRRAVQEAKASGTVNTAVLDSGLEISGTLVEYLGDQDDIQFLQFSGPVQLSMAGTQLTGHGRERHPTGFSSPLSRWKGFPAKPHHALTEDELRKKGLKEGTPCTLEFESGFRVEGKLVRTTRQGGKLLLLTWKDCRVSRQGKTFFDPSWGEFDMAVGNSVTGVQGGPSDRAAYGEFNVGTATSHPGRTSPYSSEELRLFQAYSEIRKAREGQTAPTDRLLASMTEKILREYPDEWLLSLELFEIGKRQAPWSETVTQNLARLEKEQDPLIRDLIRKGREIL